MLKLQLGCRAGTLRVEGRTARRLAAVEEPKPVRKGESTILIGNLDVTYCPSSRNG